ncbi:MAG TPA: transcription antitermination factor NusB [Anaerohalosphaeraceae bacterium]|nr:transcription antitermination factor NusB [Anaerohalosphaeraceae bacterium]HOT73184.1 transcription antitermination factor NusB [Anaerohalosphaeraceae bacterium]HPB93666.1 transcription antitermination factor NusB [Anaerohalosphaeraceae bacterium]HQG06375.1 transcription antitermination factor NusB [Anaerohalosphaeraceae bacterium]HQI07784.1 transcription antitermination factor NusB [Anaerohalosphaeraceae bacterium]
MDRRTKARELAIQAICQLDIQGADVLPLLPRFFRENSDDEQVIQLAEQWTQGTWEHWRQCEEEIAGAAEKWNLMRLSLVDRSILRLGVYQLLFCPDIPEKVAINEAIELAKKYGGVQSPRFVNGVLDAVYRRKKESGTIFHAQE